MTAKLDADQVEEFLRGQPDFFEDRSELLGRLRIRHGTHGTISLVERQLALFRKREQTSNQQLEEIIAAVTTNNEIYNKSRKLILDLIDAKTAERFFAALEGNMDTEFNCTAYSLILFGEHPQQINHFTSHISIGSARPYLGDMLDSSTATLGVLASDARDFLFRHASDKVESAAVVPIVSEDALIGLLAIGSGTLDYFHAGMGTIFIRFIADALARLLPRYVDLT
jgi:uncharacterized protein YigA (DUF484 family)